MPGTKNTSTSQRRQQAAAMLADHDSRCDPVRAVDSLAVGLTQLRSRLLTRIHDDVERLFTLDSMIAPTSHRQEVDRRREATIEIEIYNCIVADDEVRHSALIADPGDWFLDWLFQLRLGDEQRAVCDQRVAFYESPTVEDRRLKFLSVLQRTVPESVRAPLVLFRMFPRATRIVTAVAFGDTLRAKELRAEQSRFLPAIADCLECHGRVLDNDESCRICGNPVWEFDWLQAD